MNSSYHVSNIQAPGSSNNPKYSTVVGPSTFRNK